MHPRALQATGQYLSPITPAPARSPPRCREPDEEGSPVPPRQTKGSTEEQAHGALFSESRAALIQTTLMM